jgi:amino acid transporter
MKLQRSIGLVGLTFVAVSGMLGSGWLFAPELAAQQAGPAAIISWAIGGFIMFLIAITFAEVSAMLPVSGGLARVPYFSHGNVVSAAMGWTAWIGYTLTAPIEVAAMLQYLSTWAPYLQESGSSDLTIFGILLAAIFMALMVVINAWGVHFFSRINTGLTWIKILIPAVIIVTFMLTKFEVSNFTVQEFSPYGISGILAGVSTGGVIFAFIGFRHAIDLAGETRNPHKTIPLALCLSILFCLIIYAGAQLAFIGAIEPSDVISGWRNVHMNHDYGPFAALGTSLGIIWVMSIIYSGAVIAPFGGGLVATGSNARLTMAMAENNQFPGIFAALSPRGVPLNALCLNWVIGIVMLFIVDFREMVTLNGAAIILSLIAGPIAVSALRRQLPDRERYFQIPAVDFVSAIAFAAGTLTLYWSGWKVIQTLIPLLGIGLVLFGIFRQQSKDKKPLDYKEAIWLVPFLTALGLLSYFGNYGGGIGAIPFAWDLVLGIVIGLGIFFVASRSRLPAEKTVEYVKGHEAIPDITLNPYGEFVDK